MPSLRPVRTPTLWWTAAAIRTIEPIVDTMESIRISVKAVDVAGSQGPAPFPGASLPVRHLRRARRRRNALDMAAVLMTLVFATKASRLAVIYRSMTARLTSIMMSKIAVDVVPRATTVMASLLDHVPLAHAT